MRATARVVSVMLSTIAARRRLIRSFRRCCAPSNMGPVYITISRALREEPCRCSPASLAHLTIRMMGADKGQFFLINVFAEAFPEVPLRHLKRASGWHGVRRDGKSDEEFDQIPKPYIPVCAIHGKTPAEH